MCVNGREPLREHPISYASQNLANGAASQTPICNLPVFAGSHMSQIQRSQSADRKFIARLLGVWFDQFVCRSLVLDSADPEKRTIWHFAINDERRPPKILSTRFTCHPGNSPLPELGGQVGKLTLAFYQIGLSLPPVLMALWRGHPTVLSSTCVPLTYDQPSKEEGWTAAHPRCTPHRCYCSNPDFCWRCVGRDRRRWRAQLIPRNPRAVSAPKW